MAGLAVALIWVVVREDDVRLHCFRLRHYSVANVAPKKFRLGPGAKVCLLSRCGRAVLVWQFQVVGGVAGVTYCPIFRNEGAGLSSALLLAAEPFIPQGWPRSLVTFVDGRAVGGDGRCFKAAGWRKRGRTAERRLIILEKAI